MPSKLKETIYFVSIDDRISHPETGKTMIKLRNGDQILLPPNIVRIPSMIVVNQGNKVVIGSRDILKILQPQVDIAATRSDNKQSDTFRPASDVTLPGAPTHFKGDLINYEFGNMMGSVSSDKFSFIGSTDGGSVQQLETPKDDYDKSKGESLSIEKLIEKRNLEVPSVNLPGFQASLPIKVGKHN